MILNKKKNRGTGAGGAKTNENGKAFEKKVSLIPYLLEMRFVEKLESAGKRKKKINIWRKQTSETEAICYMEQNTLLYYWNIHFKTNFNISQGKRPDAAFIFYKNGIVDRITILESKTQNVDGSTKEKVETGDFKRYDYQKRLKCNKIDFAFILCDYMKEWYLSPKCELLRAYNVEKDIPCFYGEEDDFWDKLRKFIFKE